MGWWFSLFLTRTFGLTLASDSANSRHDLHRSRAIPRSNPIHDVSGALGLDHLVDLKRTCFSEPDALLARSVHMREHHAAPLHVWSLTPERHHR